MRTPCLVAAVALAAAASGAAADVRQGFRPVRSLVELRNEGVIRQHWDLTCGAAAVATLLTYQLHHPVTEREVTLAMLHRTSPLLVRARLGFSLLDLKIYAATNGFGAAGYGRMTLADLDRMAPAIVPIRAHGFRHFVVYRGSRGDRVLVADPSFGNRTLSIDAFEAVWADGIAFILFDPAEPSAPNRMGAPRALFVVPNHQSQRSAIVAPSGGGGS